jgi:hypothetical protein
MKRIVVRPARLRIARTLRHGDGATLLKLKGRRRRSSSIETVTTTHAPEGALSMKRYVLRLD